ncbi:MAG: maleylacetate reductase [Stellaceae bacterium]
MRAFIHDQPAIRCVFGDGRLDALPAEADRLGLTRLLVLSTPEQEAAGATARNLLGARAVGVFTEARMHVPVETARQARAEALRLGADGTVAIGGGTTTGLAKAIALELDLPSIAVPTTYAGSEMTSIYGLTEGGEKRTGRDEKVRPRAVIYDPTLTYSMPPRLSATSGMNALAHCVESLYAADTTPIIQLYAAESIRAFARSLPVILTSPKDADSRSDAHYAAWLAGIALDRSQMGLHHKLCHTLGGSFDLNHAEVHTVILPQATAYNAPAAPEAMRIIAAALGAENAAQGLYDLAKKLGAPVSLQEIGMKEADLDLAADLATRTPYPNPRAVERAPLRRLLENAYRGVRPGAV